jgi:hypothetical protein
MATISDSDYISKIAGEDLSSSQYMFVELVSKTNVELADAITDKVYGVLQNAPAAGEIAVIKVRGETKIVGSASLAINTIVGPSTAGKAQAAVATQFPCGRVVEAPGADGDLGVIELFSSGIAIAS